MEMLAEKQAEMNVSKNRLSTGLQKIAEANDIVSSLQEELTSKKDLVASLEAGLVALGHWDAFPAAGGGAWRPVPCGLDLAQWTRVLDVGMRPDGLAVLLVTGTLVPARLHTALLRLIAARLPRSSVIALNVGELEADAAAYDAMNG